MPLLPRGLSDQLFNRIRDRVRDQLGVETTAPRPDDPGLSSRIKQIVRERLGLDPTAPMPEEVGAEPPYYGPPRSLEEVRQRIQEAGRNLPPLMLRMLYNNRWRNVEPYSFRWRDKDDPHIPLFYAYCHKDKQTEAFKLKKVQDLQVTNQPFQPRFVVEF